MLASPWLITIPGLAIFITVLCINLFGTAAFTKRSSAGQETKAGLAS